MTIQKWKSVTEATPPEGELVVYRREGKKVATLPRRAMMGNLFKLESRTMSRKTQVNWLVNHILPAGTLVAHYRIDALLGSGGMGDVYKAFDGVLGRFVALKVLPQDVVESREDEWMKSFEWSRDGSKLIAARLSEASDVILVRDTAVQ